MILEDNSFAKNYSNSKGKVLPPFILNCSFRNVCALEKYRVIHPKNIGFHPLLVMAPS